MSNEKMTREEFLTTCYQLGYCSPIQAKEYAGDRQEFTDDDFIKVHRKYSNFGKARSMTQVKARQYMSSRFAKNDEQD